MDEPTFLRMLQDEPGNLQLRLVYSDWLEEHGDDRAAYIRLMNEYRQIEKKLAEMERLLQTQEPPISNHWLDIVFPLDIPSPAVGQCYLAPTPDAPPFVSVGTRVAPASVVCIIESMKIWNEITAGFHGVVTKILVAHDSAVDYGQILFRIARPDELPIGPADDLDNW
jgi:uncharacterized protein (TIGR02996 family)